jgi:Calx-beta domain/FG-GAP repeat
VAVGDFNGDGFPDVAAANASSGNVSVLLNPKDFPPGDAPSVSIGDMTLTEGNTGTKVATFTVTLSVSYSKPITVAYTTADGSATTADHDYVAKSGTLTFAANQTTQTFSIVINGDKKKESNEFFYVNLSNATNALIEDDLGVGTILNDEKGNGHPKH